MGWTSLMSWHRGMRAAPFALAIACAGSFTGCIGGGSESESAPEAPPALIPTGSVAVGDYVLHIQPKLGRAILRRAKPAEVAKVAKVGKTAGLPSLPGAPGLSPQIFSDVNLEQDDEPNSGSPSSVELVTDQDSVFVNDVDNCGSAQSFCADVTLNSFWARHLSNVYVEVTSILDANGNPISGHGATNSDSPPSTCKPTSGCPSNSLGLWRYTQAGADPGVLDSNGSAARQWRFANPDDADTQIMMRVVATLSYSSYTLSSSFRTVLNACTNGGTQVPTTTVTRTASMPFATTFYSTTSTTVKFNKHGYFVIGAFSVTDSGNNVALPSTSSQKPAAFAFWDDLEYGTTTTSKMCFLTTGTQPQRQFIMTWNQMKFLSPASDNPSTMTFSASIHEGSDEIDYYYQTMSGATARARGAGATVGAQDSTGTNAASGSTFNQTNFSSGRSYTLIPIP